MIDEINDLLPKQQKELNAALLEMDKKALSMLKNEIGVDL